jgi:hypothetical protein
LPAAAALAGAIRGRTSELQCGFPEKSPASILLAQIAKFESNALRRLYEITVNLQPVATV